MESTLYSTTALFTISKTLTPNSTSIISSLHRHFTPFRSTQCLHRQLASLRLRRLFTGDVCRSNMPGCASLQGRTRLKCVSNSAASFASGGGGFGGGVDGGGGGGGGSPSEGGEAKAVPSGAEDASGSSSDVIILDVTGMTCGGCAASVKRILESQPQVSSASVNLTTETAVVWPIDEAKVVPNWQKVVGDALANHLTNCGFASNLRGEGANEGDNTSS